MPAYIHHQPEWPCFTWSDDSVLERLSSVRHRQGRLTGRMESLGFERSREALLETLTQDTVKTSEIEGENLDSKQVRYSIGRRLGLDVGGLQPADRHLEGVAEMILDATRRYDHPLTSERIFGWHSSLFSSDHSTMRRIQVGRWRDDSTGPMQVVSGPLGAERVHFEAPAADDIEYEMPGFLAWFNGPAKTDLVLKAAVAHLWFVTVHPLDDGNGRVARAIADMALARSEDSPQRFYSMSGQIRKDRSEYYEILERTQKGDLDVTRWMCWFLACLDRAIEDAHRTLRAVLAKARFWQSVSGIPTNDRHRLMLDRLLDDFKGKLTTSKWANIAKCSQDTAARDIAFLVERGVLVRSQAGGRSTSYSLVLDQSEEHRDG